MKPEKISVHYSGALAISPEETMRISLPAIPYLNFQAATINHLDYHNHIINCRSQLKAILKLPN